ncbi:MAG TPA: hypothetical protein VFS49_04165 [Croceibacterium sp.]|nr:hypothetical protein [Croceibacterium sp.]
MEQAGRHSLIRTIAQHYRLCVGLAVALDAVLIFGPPVLPLNAWSWAVMLGRWLVMIIGGYALIWAFREERITYGMRHWLTTYLVFGFTGAAILNFAGTLRP